MHLALAAPSGYAREYLEKKTGHLPLKKGLVMPLSTTKHLLAYIVSMY